MTIDPTILDPNQSKLKAQSIAQSKRSALLKNKGKLIKKISQNKHERTIINDKYRRHDELCLSSLTPFIERDSSHK